MITSELNSIRCIKSGDPKFTIVSGITLAHRAGFEISDRCPNEYMWIIQKCIENGWIKPVAYMTDREMMISGLLND